MIREALIIGNAGESGADNYCAGVEYDLINYKAYLESALGGGWRAAEIKVLNRPTAQIARAAIERLKLADYSLAIFSGHGCTDSKTRSTRLELKNGHELS